MHQSVATIDSPQFINLQPLDINPLMSSCEIKVLYIGQNRNHSYITKEVATEMSKTLRGSPIVGWYKEEKEDFADHGDVVIIDDEGIKFKCMTVPYGFVSPDAKVWFQNFTDTDEFGNEVVREYLMTTGYLWTGQFEEAKKALEGSGKPQSMELDENTLNGHWAEDNNSHMDFFIINDATFSKLCILGDDVEPCFEGSSVTKPTISEGFNDYKLNKNPDIRYTLFNMMKDLEYALKGDKNMPTENTPVSEPETTTPVAEPAAPTENSLDNSEQASATESQNNTEASEGNSDFAKKDDDKKKSDDDSNKDDSKDGKDAEDSKDDSDTEDKDKKKKFELLIEEHETLKKNFAALQEDYNALVAFKNSIEDKQKDTMIDSFYTLSDEDKKDVIENKAKYSLDEIESKLSVLFARQQKQKTEDEVSSTKQDSPVTTFSIPEGNESVPGWIAALRNTKKSKE